MIGSHYSSACYLDGALPATLYLALRYADNPRDGSIENVMVGGDNCHRRARGYRDAANRGHPTVL